jgi:hypothetical protein
MFFIALCTSSFEAETPRKAYRFEVSELMKLVCVVVGQR